MTGSLIVAIDGPSGVGKSTAARMLASRLRVPYLETGAMYRALGLKALVEGADPDDPEAIESLLATLDLDLEITEDGEIVVLLDGRDVRPRIRGAEVSNATSRISVHPVVRRFMVDLQKRWALRRGAVVEGRDIGTRVFPETPYKFFFEAAPEVRAARRYEQLRQAGATEVSLAEVERQVHERDARDSGRTDSPLRRDESYVTLDTGQAGPEEIVAQMLRAINERRPAPEMPMNRAQEREPSFSIVAIRSSAPRPVARRGAGESRALSPEDLAGRESAGLEWTRAMAIAAQRTELLRTWALEVGFDRVGVARLEPVATGQAFLHWLDRGEHAEMAYLERRTEARLDPREIFEGARTAICVALQYHPVAPQPQGGDLWPRVARYARGRDYHNVMIKRLRRLARRVEKGFPGSRAKPYVDTGPVLERDLAATAGLGAVGKNTLLLHPDAGSYFLLGELFTSLDLEPDAPVADLCGSCSRCLEACPTGALPEPFRLDADAASATGRSSTEARSRTRCGRARRVGVRVRPLPGGVPAQRPPVLTAEAAFELPAERGRLDLAGLLALDERPTRRPFEAAR